ncbi:hypothetical protein M422DRAFT_246837 [Sphaerobolus stellatus SS14]|nr:hypothetical protein M422DRAFT_246837 [Sphaerobolus stellatus SS14]
MQTINAWFAFHEAQVTLRLLIECLQTNDDLTLLVNKLNTLHQTSTPSATHPVLPDPPVIQHKGRPRMACITSGIEGTMRGGGEKKRTRCTLDKVPPSQPIEESLLLPLTPPSQSHNPLEHNPVMESPHQQ